MPKVFVSYRREDSAAITGHLCDRLKDRFGAEQIFFDAYDIPYGVDFVAHIQGTLSKCDVLLAVIGRNWRGRVRGGKSRLDRPDDIVRLELEIAFSRSMAILPVLVDGARMPPADKLPIGIGGISTMNAAPLAVGTWFHQHADRICSAVEDIAARVVGRHGEGPAANKTPLSVARQVGGEWFSAFTGGGSYEVEYQCTQCGFQGFIEKLDWFRDGERPPRQCPKCSNTSESAASTTVV